MSKAREILKVIRDIELQNEGKVSLHQLLSDSGFSYKEDVMAPGLKWPKHVYSKDNVKVEIIPGRSENGLWTSMKQKIIINNGGKIKNNASRKDVEALLK